MMFRFLTRKTTVLDRLTVSSLFRLEPELFDVLDEVRADPTTRVLVIDNIASLLRDALMGATAQGGDQGCWRRYASSSNLPFHSLTRRPRRHGHSDERDLRADLHARATHHRELPLPLFPNLPSLQITNSPASSVPSNSLSTFSSTAIKPSLGSSLSFETDVEILLQDTGRVFGLADQGERDRASSAPGLRVLAEVLKSRVSVSS